MGKIKKIKEEEVVLITSEELQQELDIIFDFVHDRFSELKKKRYAEIEVYKKYGYLIQPLSTFDNLYNKFKQMDQEKEKKNETEKE